MSAAGRDVVLPDQKGRRRHNKKSVGEFAEDRERDDDGNDLIGPPKLLTIDKQIAQPLPAKAEPLAECKDIGGKNGGQQDPPNECRPRQAKHTAHFDDLAINRNDRTHHPQIDRKKHAHRDQGDLGCLEYAEPQDEQRYSCNRRDSAQALQGGIHESSKHR
jgi:hypothetical protein